MAEQLIRQRTWLPPQPTTILALAKKPKSEKVNRPSAFVVVISCIAIFVFAISGISGVLLLLAGNGQMSGFAFALSAIFGAAIGLSNDIREFVRTNIAAHFN